MVFSMSYSNLTTHYRFYFAIILPLVIAIVSLTFFSLRFPSDGAYYHALADNLVLFGTLEDASIIPKGPVLTYQNGISYFLAALKFMFGTFWWIAYVLIVSLIWTICCTRLHSLVTSVVDDIYSTKLIPLTLFLTIAPLLHYNSILIIGSFYNEAIFFPIVWLLFVEHCLLLTSQREGNTLKFGITYKDTLRLRLVFIFVITLGVFFRIQGIAFVVSIAAGLLFSKHISFRVFLIIVVIPVLEFAILKYYQHSPLSNHLLSNTLNVYEFDFNRLLSLMTAPISLISVSSPNNFLANSPLSLLIMIFSSALSIFGLAAVYKKSQALFVTFLALIITNGIFLLILPIYSSRYEHIMTVPILILYLYGLGFFRKMMIASRTTKIVSVSVLLLTIIILSYSVNHFYSKKSITTYTKIQNYKKGLASLDRSVPFIIYSEEPRYTYWFSGMPSCTVAPPECFLLQGMSSLNKMFYIGDSTVFGENQYLDGYVLVIDSEKDSERHDGKGHNVYGIWEIRGNRHKED